MDRNSKKAWLYLLPALVLLGLFLIYPLVDVLMYSVEECYNFASQTYQGIGLYNYSYVLHDPYFLQAVENTFVLVIITVPTSTVLAIVIATALSSIKPLRQLFQTIYFLPYVTNTLAVGLVFLDFLGFGLAAMLRVNLIKRNLEHVGRGFGMNIDGMPERVQQPLLVRHVRQHS